jgi:NADP-reducing hydrogenase subunit HndB
MAATINLREESCRAKITVHMGTCGIAAGARDIVFALLEAADENDVSDVIIDVTKCAEQCSMEPMMVVDLKGQRSVTYIELNPEKARRVFSEHILGGNVVTDFALSTGSEQNSQESGGASAVGEGRQSR